MSSLDNSALSPTQSLDRPSLPAEIFVEIFSLATREALFPLSVCSRDFRAIALPFLFRDLCLRVSNTESFNALWYISRTDYLANSVKSIKIEALTDLSRPIDSLLLSGALPFFTRLQTLTLGRSFESRQLVAFEHSLQLAILNHTSLLSMAIDGVYDFDPNLKPQVSPRNGRPPLALAAISSSSILPTHVELPFFQHLSHLGIQLSSLSIRFDESGHHLLSHLITSGLQSLHIKVPYAFPSSNPPSSDWIPRFIKNHPLLRSIKLQSRTTRGGLIAYFPSSSLALVPGFEGFIGVDRWWRSVDASCEEVILEFSKASLEGSRRLEGLIVKAGSSHEPRVSDLEEIDASFPTLQKLRFEGRFWLAGEDGRPLESNDPLPSLTDFVNTFPPFPNLVDLNLPPPSFRPQRRRFCSHITADVEAMLRGTSRLRVDLLERLRSMPVSPCFEADAPVLEIWTSLARNLPALKYLSWDSFEDGREGLGLRLDADCRKWEVVRDEGGGVRLWDGDGQSRLDCARGCVGSRKELLRLLELDEEAFEIAVGAAGSEEEDEEASRWNGGHSIPLLWSLELNALLRYFAASSFFSHWTSLFAGRPRTFFYARPLPRVNIPSSRSSGANLASTSPVASSSFQLSI